MDKLYEQFLNPDASYRPAPFWIWNEEMKGEEVNRQMKTMKEHGFGGGFAHVRQGLVTPYMEEDYFKCWGECMEFCKKEGLKLYMYDENGWPSGSAGGLVAEKINGTLLTTVKYQFQDANGVRFHIENRAQNYPIMAVYAYDGSENSVKRIESYDLSAEELAKISDKFVLIYRRDDDGGYPDVSRKDITQAFIETTYDEHYKRFGEEFGKTIPAVFSDEACITGYERDAIVYSEDLSEKFYEMHGYRIEDNLPAVYENFKGDFAHPAEKIRYDYNVAMGQLWIDNFVKPITNWCAAHGVAWTGHDQEHHWPTTKVGLFTEQRTYAYRQWPGMDWLLCDALREDNAWNDTFLMHEVRSAANQFNKEKTIVEAYGAAGWHATFKDFKRIADWLLVNGLNFFCQHLTHYSIIGARKRDCPQSIDWRQPWWDEYTEYNDYLTRAGVALTTGKMEQRILYMNPSTTGYLVPISQQSKHLNHTKGFDVITTPDMYDFLESMQRMQDEQWDYDIGEEFTMEDFGRVDGKQIVIGQGKYDVVVLSDSMKNIRRATVDMLTQFAKAGGKIIATGNAAEYIDGVRCPEELAEFRKLWTIVNGCEGLLDELDKILPKRVTSSNGWVRGIAFMRRQVEDGREIYFFTNHSLKEFNTKITLKGRSVTRWDLYTGEKRGIPCERCGDNITFDLNLEWTQAELLVINDDEPVAEAIPQALVEVKLATEEIVPEKDNNIILDHCVLTVNGESTKEIYYAEAAERLYASKGIKRNPWLHWMQHHDEFISRTFPGDNGFEACYSVLIKEGCLPEYIAAVTERPDLMKIRVNGVNVEWKGCGHYLDYKMGKTDITSYVKEGMNDIVIWSDQFHILDELEMVILEGDFGVSIQEERFVIDKKPEKLNYGSWIDQKWRFYPNAMLYRLKANLDKKPENAKLMMGKHEASAMSVIVNGEYAGTVGQNGEAYAEISKWLKAGENDIVVRVCGSFRNLFGPYINYKDQTVAVGDMFTQVVMKGEVNPASMYDMIHYGLFEEPVLFVNK